MLYTPRLVGKIAGLNLCITYFDRISLCMCVGGRGGGGFD